ncbi:MAG: glucose/galactose MFS transporter, partial [Planctomycetota bacterium]
MSSETVSARDSESALLPNGILIPFILITSCFAWWGLANNMTDTLLAAFKRIMSMSDFQTSWIQIA